MHDVIFLTIQLLLLTPKSRSIEILPVDDDELGVFTIKVESVVNICFYFLYLQTNATTLDNWSLFVLS